MPNAFSKGAVRKAQSAKRRFPNSDSRVPIPDLGSPLRIIITVLAVFVFSQAVALFLAEVIVGLLHPGTDLSNDFDNSAPAQFFYILIAEGLAAWLVIKLVRRRRLGLGFIGLGRWPTWRDGGRAVMGFIAFYAMLLVASAIVSAIWPAFNTNETQDIGFNNLNTFLDGAAAFISLVILPPLGEETLVRGYLYSGLRARLKFLPSLLITSLLFGLAHLQTGNTPAALWAAGLDTFLLSVVLVYLRENTGALYAGMAVHMLNNLVAFGFHFH